MKINKIKIEWATLIKSICYRLFASSITFIIAYMFTKEIKLSAGIGILEFFGKIFGYYIFEIIWKNIIIFLNAKSYRDNCYKFDKSGICILISGLNCSGKTTIAKELVKHMKNTILLDGDAIRSGINYDLGFTPHDIRTNLQKISNLAKILIDQGFNVIISCISKNKNDRLFIKQNIVNNYIEVHVDCDQNVLEQRQKLLHKNTKIIQTNYEESDYDVIKVDTSKMNEAKCVKKILKEINK